QAGLAAAAPHTATPGAPQRGRAQDVERRMISHPLGALVSSRLLTLQGSKHLIYAPSALRCFRPKFQGRRARGAKQRGMGTLGFVGLALMLGVPPGAAQAPGSSRLQNVDPN